MNILKKLMMVATLVATTLAQAVIPEMEVWSDGKGHYRYLLKDFHVDYPDGLLSIKQQEDIIWAARQNNASIIAEDPNHPGNGSEKIKVLCLQYRNRTIYDTRLYVNQYYVDIQQALNSEKITVFSPLLSLANACQESKIFCYNAECDQVIDLYQSKLHGPETISREDVIEQLQISIKEIGSHTYAPWFNALIARLKTLPKNDPTFVTIARELRYHLVNAKTVHQLRIWKAIKHCLICEGANHIENIKPWLIMLGYKKIKRLGKENILDKAFNFFKTTRADHEFLAYTIVLRNALDLKKEFAAIFAEQAAEKKLKASSSAATAAAAPLIKSKL